MRLVCPAVKPIEGMRACPQSNIRLKLPVFLIMARFVARNREVGELVLSVALTGQKFASGLISLGHEFFLWHGVCVVAAPVAHHFPAQAAVLIYLEEIDGDVLRLERGGGAKGAQPGGLRLVRQSGDQIEAQVRKPGLPRAPECLLSLGGRVQAADGAQLTVVEGLGAEAQAIDAQRACPCKVLNVRRAGRKLHSKFVRVEQSEPPIERRPNLLQSRGAPQRRRPATQVNRIDGKSQQRGESSGCAPAQLGVRRLVDLRQAFDFALESLAIGVPDPGWSNLRAEVAKAALRSAEGKLDINSQGWHRSF